MAPIFDSMRGKGGRHVPLRGPSEFADDGYCGRSIHSGLVRFHDSTTAPMFRQYCFEMFPQLMSIDSQADVLAFDWNGRQYLTAQADGMPDVVMFVADLATDTLEELIPVEYFGALLEQENVGMFFNGDLYDHWRASIGKPEKYVDFEDCVGFKIPFWLSGVRDISNLQLSNMDVHWGFGVQIREQTRDLQPGAQIELNLD